MLRLRFKRTGRKKLPSYRFVITDSRKRRDGRPSAEIGFYNPITKKIKIDFKMVSQRLAQGMQLTKPVKLVLKRFKILF
uniref:Ribosomal protein S16 n=1 Tax=Hildenbrandia rivularis TaxID=135206 RepID=A0A1C9CFM5_9FLOR|nr:ribosomal protein S16 [Hildenbrandia rivularis]AOM67198.1 ribosomal protein S16 [Hildenbrandia rivularis]